MASVFKGVKYSRFLCIATFYEPLLNKHELYYEDSACNGESKG